MKIRVIILTLALLSLCFVAFAESRTTVNRLNEFSYTMALCDDGNFCQDYEISCKDNEIVSSTPLTGAFVQHDESWVDFRETGSEISCVRD